MSRIDKTTWRRIRLGEVGNTYGGLTGKSKGDFGQGKAKYITFLNVLNNTNIDTSQLEVVKVEVDENQNQVRRGDLFFNTSSETPEQVGMCAMLNDEAPFTFLNSFCFGYRLHDKTINPLYLVHYFNGAQGRKIMGILAQGATRYNLSKESFLKTELSIPDYHEQSNVVDAISALETEISNLHRLIAKQEAIKKSTVKLLLKPSQDCTMVKLGNVAEIYRGGSPRPIQDYITNDANGINWIKIGDVAINAKYIKQTKERIKLPGIAMSRQVKAGDFILSNSMSFGRPYILKIDGCIHDGWLAIQNYQATFNVDYLYYLLGSDFVFAQYVEKAAGSSVKNLNKEVVSSITLPCLSIQKQCNIAKQISALDEVIKSCRAQLAKVQQLKAGVMRHFFG